MWGFLYAIGGMYDISVICIAADFAGLVGDSNEYFIPLTTAPNPPSTSLPFPSISTYTSLHRYIDASIQPPRLYFVADWVGHDPAVTALSRDSRVTCHLAHFPSDLTTSLVIKWSSGPQVQNAARGGRRPQQ